jgi:hypothetical protein
MFRFLSSLVFAAAAACLPAQTTGSPATAYTQGSARACAFA